MDASIFAIILMVFYFMPTLIARSGRRGSVFVINLFLGRTMLGWVVALFMAVRSTEGVA